MPLYVYQSDGGGCERCYEGFEVLEGMEDSPLAECPQCGDAIQRVPSSFNAGRGDVLSDSNLREHGFSKLRNTEDGLHREV